ncbi:hypothetical protein PMI36_05349 [Pseudomonas sp. GM79]|uniref:hypothetical protein n=1 Tax=Pseudomonas sp. GM79 TaxID=1144338 RepID=UPI00026F50C5|nr:hypothetical protein [Pseudomonas sp. GM79]EJN17932.1 hypothetical protein PMI36_05349 [Pseudomonas sp. GM79]
MPNKGTKVYCPNCRKFTICRALSPTKAGKPKAQRWYKTDHRDISWFRRARACSSCESLFLTAEIDERILEELIALRTNLAKKNLAIVGHVRSTRPWLVRTEDVPRELAEEFIRRTAWWHTHSSGSPVRAPKHSDRIYRSHHGWTIDFGANSFLVGKAISRCSIEINKFIDGSISGNLQEIVDLKKKLIMHIRGAVANNNQDEYAGYYSLTGPDMMFGAQSIDVEDGANFIIQKSGINELICP